MTQRVEAHRRYADTKAFRLDAREMKSDGWSVEEAHFVPSRRGIFGGIVAGTLRRPRAVEVYYLRSGLAAAMTNPISAAREGGRILPFGKA